jgi:cation-transporting ATPase E
MEHDGLTSRQVADRIARGQVNRTSARPSRTVRDILFTNIFTRFNAILFTLMVGVIIVDGSIFNSFFGLVMIINSAIGIIQELHAKSLLDKLAILNAPRAMVVRDGHEHEIATTDVVLGELIHLRNGDQVIADGEVIYVSTLELDESLLTGESDSISKPIGTKVLSGSIVVAGDGYMRVTAVGDQAYSSKITEQAKRFKKADSDLMKGINRLLRWISWILIVIAPIIIYGQIRLDHGNWRSAIVHATAAVVGMIPEGLVLLTSMAFMLAAVSLARRKVLVQQLSAVEGLARVDTLLLDKTGTLTEGNISFDALIHANPEEEAELYTVLATIASRSSSPTNDAIRRATRKYKPAELEAEVPFNSARKWSSVTVGGKHWLLGAPDILFTQKSGDMFVQAQDIAESGKRVLVLMRTEATPTADNLPARRTPVALVILSERVRRDAPSTLKYFAEQGVDIKIISGDNPLTVAAVARQVGLAVTEPFDARSLPTSKKQLAAVLETHNVFGRVQPEQKRAIVQALQSAGHTVAMTGDGVNDALALKDSDIGIAMQSGTTATKSVAELILLDNKFSRLPHVIGEGRRVIANIERVANLFIIKNVYSLVLALAVTVIGMTYPYLPGQMSVMSSLAIGIPAFFLALAPNKRRYVPGFLRRVLLFAIPVGIVSAIAMLSNYYLALQMDATRVVAGTTTAIILMMVSTWALFTLSKPINWWKLGLISLMFITFITIVLVPGIAVHARFQLDWDNVPITVAIGVTAIFLLEILARIIRLFADAKSPSKQSQ